VLCFFESTIKEAKTMNTVKLNHKLDEVLAQVTEFSAHKEVLNATEAAKYLSLSQAYLYRLTSARQIPHYKPGKKLYFKRSELDDWMLRNKQESENELDEQAAVYLATKDIKKK
jgi:excisionase family DNA binding protein